MTKIYIFENTNSLHIEEALVTLRRVFKQNYEVQFCLNDKAINRVKNNTEIMGNVINISKIYDFVSFLKNIDRDDIVIYPTVSARNINLLYLMSFYINKNIYYIRNSNSWLKYSNHQDKIIFKLISNITTFLKKKLLKKSYQIFVANSNLKNYLEENQINKTINIVPYKFFDESNYTSNLDINNLKIVIPGGIDISKKDLLLIREATKSLTQDIKNKFTIILLGKPSRKEDLHFCEEWKKEMGKSLEYFTSFIPDSQFTNTLKESHFVLGILTIDYEDKYNKEVYGLTKDTGVDAQAIAYGKPLIINQEFKVASEIETSSIGFTNSHDLSKIIEGLVNSKNYNEVSLNAMQNSKQISRENIINKLKGI
jgi:hypothetical protein